MVSSISRSAPAPSKKPSAPPYNALLTPFLHRRFVRAFSITLLACYLEAFLMSNKRSIFWSVFPLGPSGIKTILLAGSILPLLVLRVAQLHVPVRGGESPMHILINLIRSGDVFRTFGTYCFSAFAFTQIYLWSTDASAELGIAIKKSSYELPRLNERYLYLIYFACYIGAISGISHLLLDRDFLDFSTQKTNLTAEFESQIPRSLTQVCSQTLFAAFSWPILYVFFRRLLWTVSLAVVKIFYRLHRDETPHRFPLSIGLLIRSMWIGFHLMVVWEISNVAFSIYFTQKPVKDGKTISERSSDPNASLVWGLRMRKKPLAQATAFLELSYISQNSSARRISIFKDIRSPICIWDQIVKECLEVIGEISKALDPPPTSNDLSTQETRELKHDQKPASMSSLPSKTFKQVVDENVWRTPPKQVPLQSWQAPADRIPKSPFSIGAISQGILPVEHLESSARSYLDMFMTQNLGSVFRMTLHDRTRNMLPNSAMQRDAIISLTRFSCFSLEEDEYGLVQKSLPGILLGFDAAMASIENYLAKPSTQALGVDSKETREALSREPDMLLSVLKSGMGDIGDAFGPYMKGLNLPGAVARRLKQICA